MPVGNLIQIRRDTAANWTSVNPTLAAGEFGLETDTNLKKLGNGTDDWVTLGYEQSDWDALVGIPSEFPPSAHSHVKTDITDFAHSHVKTDITDFAHSHPTSDVTGLDTALAGKAPTVHSHAITDVTGLDTALAGKAPTVHTHTISQITDYVPPVITYSDTFMMMGA